MANSTFSVLEVLSNTKSSSIDSIEIKYINPIESIEARNDSKTVDVLLQECADLVDQRYKPWFAKRFYGFEKHSVLKAASIARQEGKNSQKLFCNFIKIA